MSENQYVIFKLEHEEFGIDIMNVKEIGPYKEIISLPNTPIFIEGVINHRGSVIPIINLKKRLKIGEFKITKDTRIIIINLEDKEIGFIVDEASQTLRLEEEQLEREPSFNVGGNKRYITGIGKLNEKRLVVLMDLEKLLSEEEAEEIKGLKG